ncbi:MAG: flagellar hook-length control protein FliK [Fimbriimonadales bacterium]|nr:MAG: hypothetical protein KatS3mg018_1149 [Fimbriimonadales bacterium]
MVGVNLLMVGAVAETSPGDTPAAPALSGETAEFEGLLEALLPTGGTPSPDAETGHEAPDPEAARAQLALLGAMTLPLPSPLLLVESPHAPGEPEVCSGGAAFANHWQGTLSVAEESNTATTDLATPEHAPAVGDGWGDLAFPDTQLIASENLQMVEGDAPPVPARLATPPSPPTSFPILAETPRTEPVSQQVNAQPSLGATQENPSPQAAPEPLSAFRGEAPAPLHESIPVREEPSAPPHEARVHQGHTLTPATAHTAPTGTDAAHSRPAAPNWSMAEQVAQHIERMVYERERNSLTVRLDPPELGVVELRVQATGGEVQAWLSAERDLTRQMLQQAQQYLREQLESRGLQLTHFDVGAQRQFHHAPREQTFARATPLTSPSHTPAATDSLPYDGRWSVWV